MPKETALYDAIFHQHYMDYYYYSPRGDVKSESKRSATPEEFAKFMKLHDPADYAESTVGKWGAIKDNFSVENMKDLTLTRIDLDTNDGRHHVAFELSSKLNDWHTMAIFDEAVLKVHDGNNSEFMQWQVTELTALVDETEVDGVMLLSSTGEYGPSIESVHIDLFDIDAQPTSAKILHDVVVHHGDMIG